MTTALQYVDITTTANKSDVKHDTQRIDRVWCALRAVTVITCELPTAPLVVQQIMTLQLQIKQAGEITIPTLKASHAKMGT